MYSINRVTDGYDKSFLGEWLITQDRLNEPVAETENIDTIDNIETFSDDNSDGMDLE